MTEGGVGEIGGGLDEGQSGEGGGRLAEGGEGGEGSWRGGEGGGHGFELLVISHCRPSPGPLECAVTSRSAQLLRVLLSTPPSQPPLPLLHSPRLRMQALEAMHRAAEEGLTTQLKMMLDAGAPVDLQLEGGEVVVGGRGGGEVVGGRSRARQRSGRRCGGQRSAHPPSFGRGGSGRTPLMLAVEHGHLEAAQVKRRNLVMAINDDDEYGDCHHHHHDDAMMWW